MSCTSAWYAFWWCSRRRLVSQPTLPTRNNLVTILTQRRFIGGSLSGMTFVIIGGASTFPSLADVCRLVWGHHRRNAEHGHRGGVIVHCWSPSGSAGSNGACCRVRQPGAVLATLAPMAPLGACAEEIQQAHPSSVLRHHVAGDPKNNLRTSLSGVALCPRALGGLGGVLNRTTYGPAPSPRRQP